MTRAVSLICALLAFHSVVDGHVRRQLQSEEAAQPFSVDDSGIIRTSDNLRTVVRTAPHLHHLDLSSLLTLNFNGVSQLETLHLMFDDENESEFIGRIDAVVRSIKDAEAEIYLAGGFKATMGTDGLVLYDPAGKEMKRMTRTPASGQNDTDTDEGDTRRMQGAFFGPGSSFDSAFGGPGPAIYGDHQLDGCPAMGCGSVRVGLGARTRGRNENCELQTGVEGGYDPCQTPAVNTANFANPVRDSMLGIDPVDCNYFMHMGCSFEQRNGWGS
ncbi:unnamed protein product [Vitrella brassicaformis CCMP3155]|uniref:Uncharacterized protein n=1 Tax=Vitrella brassicaformis (strain CCMP3155) TaxID=1169540 RepID=A0A0G4GEX7_VITBC|nr:unnamed protein product [Vitrella brassicaformis CCMP3155]|eukprot:CEM28076.1 unnamed protein product [Vitrella brassicaformis CCMP3155]